MPLSPSTLADLRAELASLQTLRDRIDQRIQVLEAATKPFDVAQAVLPLSESELASGFGTNIPIDAGKLATTGHPPNLHFHNPFASTGLRNAIVQVLRKRGPMRAPDVANVLESVGFKNDSSTPLATRVYNDLWRMAQKGVAKNEYGVFSLVKEE